ncbi:MAG: helix-turn-helix transcriptional regulator [Clostridia bacterium]|nr:helix-turn-helix transcriptional regulator [Clostridia bacterium]
MKLSQRIREIREDRDLTQTDIAIILKTSQTVYSRYERNERTLPTELLYELCKYYNLSADYLLGLSDDPKPLK